MPEPERPLVSTADIEGMTTWTLIRLGHHLERLLTEALRAEAVTPLQYGVLAHLSARPALTQTQLAAAVLVRPQSMQHHLDRLEQLGLLERAPKRGRGQPNAIRLTAAGSKVLTDVHRIIEHANDATTLGLPPEELARLDATAHLLLRLPSLSGASIAEGALAPQSRALAPEST